jgi:hypothetical protein
MPGVIVCVPPGNKLGNSAMSYLHARAHADRVGAELQMDPWIGERIFEITRIPIEDRNRNLPRRTEFDLAPRETDIELRTYAQAQPAMIYRRDQARLYLPLMLGIKPDRTLRGWGLSPDELNLWLSQDRVCAHRRVGDYIGYGYPVVSLESIMAAKKKWGYEDKDLDLITEEDPRISPTVPADIAWFPDFLTMLRAKVLFRGNSTFSWVAGLLGYGTIFSPVIDGLEGGREHLVDFVEGNHKRFANLPFVTDLHVQDETVY